MDTLTREQLEDRLERAEARNLYLENQVNWLMEQFKLAKHRQFGSSSEKTSALLQHELVFNEAEAILDSVPEVVVAPSSIRAFAQTSPPCL